MKKATIFFAIVLFSTVARSQDGVEVGYRTTDIGAQFQYHYYGTVTSLHAAFNSRMHHSLLVQFGYIKADRKDKGEKDEETGSGWGGGLGYRYYFRPHPHKLFIGLKADIYKMKIDWADGILTGQSRTWMLQPSLELGYTIVVNDQGFITPFIASGYQANVKTEGDKVGQGLVPIIGISAGFRL